MRKDSRYVSIFSFSKSTRTAIAFMIWLEQGFYCIAATVSQPLSVLTVLPTTLVARE